MDLKSMQNYCRPCEDVISNPIKWRHRIFGHQRIQSISNNNMSGKELFKHRQHVVWTVGLVCIEHHNRIVRIANGVINTNSNRFTFSTAWLNDDVATGIDSNLTRSICAFSINDEDLCIPPLLLKCFVWNRLQYDIQTLCLIEHGQENHETFHMNAFPVVVFHAFASLMRFSSI